MSFISANDMSTMGQKIFQYQGFSWLWYKNTEMQVL